MIRVLHAADLHLDSPFQALGREKAARRRSEQRSLLERIVALAAEKEADVLLLAGDLLDSDAAFSETGRMLERVFASVELPVFIAPGNHDWYSVRSPWARLELGEKVHVFQSERMECILLPELGGRIWGSAFCGRSRGAVLKDFEAEKDGDLVDIMVIHGEVGAPHSSYGPLSEQELERSGMDYVALGHVHSCSGLRRAGDTFYAWPGCPEGRGFDETGEKGVILAEVEPGVCRAEFIPLEGRRYEVLKVDITNEEDVAAAVIKALPERAGRDVYRIVLQGETEYPPDMTALRRALEGRVFALELRDESRLSRDIWDGCGQDSLRGLFLSRLRELYENAPDEAHRERAAQAARWGLQAMDNGEELPL